jgi:hypothetical protein
MRRRKRKVETKPAATDLERKTWALCLYCYERKADVKRVPGIEFKCCPKCVPAQSADWL